MNQLPDYQIRAFNDAVTSENRIHSDEVARKFGFTGALVSGVSVFGYLTYPLVKAYGGDWLSSGVAEVKFLKPAYAEDLLTIKTETIAAGGKRWHHMVSAFNDEGTLLAQLESWLPLLPPQVDRLAGLAAPAAEVESKLERPDINLNLIQLNKPAPAFEFTVGHDLHKESLNVMRDDLEVYANVPGAFVHPYTLLKQCNLALMRMFVLPAWVHVGSKLVIHAPIKVGQEISVLTVPIDKWERKGHQFIKLYIAMKVAGEVALEVEHTAIFKLAEPLFT